MAGVNRANRNDPPAPPGYIDATSLATGQYYQPLILNKVFDLLVLMIDTLQKTAANQAERLNFLADWQKAYTDQMNQIQAFVSGNGFASNTIPISEENTSPNVHFSKGGLDSAGSSAATQLRQDLNTANTTFTQQMQGNSQTISDTSKALQTNVNQSNDAVQSQTDMATSILQQLQTILTSIYQTT